MAAPLKILLLGHRGMVGQALLALQPDLQVLSGGRQEFDLTLGYRHVKQALGRTGAKVCINCIALAQVDDCEKHPAQAWLVNSLGAAHLALACAELKIRLVHLSTDYVFNGMSTLPYQERDSCQPLNAYGRSKLAGELAVSLHHPQALIIRTSLVFGLARESWLERPWRQYLEGKSVRVVDDQYACPTWAPDLARALLCLADNSSQGLLHAAGQGYASRLEICRYFFEIAGLDPQAIQPARSGDFPGSAARPAFSALNCDLLARQGINMLPWRESLTRHWQALREHERNNGQALS